MVTASLIAVGTYSYLSIAKKVEVMLGERLEHMVRTGTLGIDYKDHDEIENAFLSEEPELSEKPFFKKIKNHLDNVKKINDLNVEVYTVIAPEWGEGNMIFMAMSGDKNFTGNSMPLNVTVKKVIETGLPQHTDLYEDEEGVWVSAMAPIKNDKGKVIAVMELDYEAHNEVQAAKNEVLMAIGIPALVAFIISVMLGNFLGKSLAKPIIVLADAAGTVSKGNLDVQVTITTSDETGTLTRIFNSMVSEIKTSRIQLEDYAKNLEEKVRQRTAEVVASKKKIQNILDNIEQGVVTFGSNFQIDDEFSAFVTKLYSVPKEEVVGKNYYDFLFPNPKITSNDANILQETIKAVVGEDELAWQLNSDHLPHELVITTSEMEKIIGIDWTPMIDPEGLIERVMVVIKDLTEQRKLELQLEQERRESQQMVSGIIEMMKHPKQKISSFVKDTHARLDSVSINIKSQMDLKQMFIDLHTIKGSARVLGLNSLTNSTHEAEEPVQKLRNQPSDTESLELLKKNFEILVGDFTRFSNTFEKIYGASDSGNAYSSLLSLLSQQIDGINQRVKESNLSINSISLLDEVVAWDEKNLNKFASIFVHALNNSVDHGFILPMKRGEKINDIKLTISAKKQKNSHIEITVSDSGNGIRLEKIKEIATKKGFAVKSEQKDELFGLLFEDGFSTEETVTETSGRGVGLSAIKKFTTEIGGTVKIENNESQTGSLLTISLPTSET
jgi:signal transduction histidine kinase/HAMP domain-containing protein